MSQADLPLTFLVGGALVTVAGVLYHQITSRTKRAEDQVDKYHGMLQTVVTNQETEKELLLDIRAELRNRP